MVSNLTQCAAFNTTEIIEEQSIKSLESISSLIIESDVSQIARIFKETNATKTLEVQLGKVFKELMKISDEFLNILDARVTKGELETS